jgi:hypothetical protein
VPNLARALAHHYPSEDVARWVRQFLALSGTIETMRLLRSITLAIKEEFVYTQRSEKGCLVNSIFMGRGAPGQHESSVAKLLFREFGSL